MTLDLARIVRPGKTVGFDREAAQFAESARAARDECLPLTFEAGDVRALPFADASFDVVFAHALIEHLSDPLQVVREFVRILRPNGILAVRSPDWGGFILNPYPADVQQAIHSYRDIMVTNGGDPVAGRKLAALLRDCGLREVVSSATYEIYEEPRSIAEYLAEQLNRTDPMSAKALLNWGRDRDALFAQAWIEALAIYIPE